MLPLQRGCCFDRERTRSRRTAMCVARFHLPLVRFPRRQRFRFVITDGYGFAVRFLSGSRVLDNNFVIIRARGIAPIECDLSFADLGFVFGFEQGRLRGFAAARCR